MQSEVELTPSKNI